MEKVVQLIQHDAGADANSVALLVKIGNLTVMPREIDHQPVANRAA